jgi:zinc D-Ala-D-Ala dipeptidase
LSDPYPPIPVTHLPSEYWEIGETGEDLEPVAVSTIPWYNSHDWPYSSERLRVRAGVNTRLLAAQQALPPGYALVVLDAWRDSRLQRALFQHYDSEGTPPGYVAAPGSAIYEPPHTTGGAIDVTLSWRGVPLALGTAFDTFDEAAWARALEERPDTEPARSLRRMLTAALVSEGFCPHPMEWWHFSFGDQIWAANSGKDHALYGPIAQPS